MTAAMTEDLHYLELVELAALIKAGDVSPVAVTRAQLDRIAALDGALRLRSGEGRRRDGRCRRSWRSLGAA